MTDLNQRISEFIAKKEDASDHEWQTKATDGENDSWSVVTASGHVVALMVDCLDAKFIAAAANDAVPLLLACQERIAQTERILREIAYEPHACGSNGAVIAQSYFETRGQG